MVRTWIRRIGFAALGFVAGLAALVSVARAGGTMSDYTWMPIFMQNTVPPNILFIVDFSDAMLPAAYGTYPLSFNNAATYSSNYAGTGLTGDVSDTFAPTTSYYGIFDPLRCYTYANSNPKGFGNPAVGPVQKLNNDVSQLCDASGTTPSTATAPWDGNFLNWLAMRKLDVAKQVLIGGFAIPAGNTDGTADVLGGETPIGLNGSTNKCASTSDPCWRFVKFVRHGTLQGRIDTSLEAGDTAWTAGSSAPLGPGQATSSGATVTAYLGAGPTSFSSTFAVGDIIKVGGAFAPKNVTAVTDAQHLTFSPGAFSPDITNATTYTRFFPKTGVSYPGAITVTAASNAVTGSSTATPTTFTSSFAAGTDAIQIRVSGTFTDNTDPIQLVSTVGSAASLTAGASFGTVGAAPYTIFKPSGAAAPGVVSTSGTAVTGSGVTSSANFSSTFVAGDALIAGSEAQNVSAIGSTTALTTSLAFSSNLSLGTGYSTATKGAGTAAFSNSNTGVTGTSTAFTTTFVPGDMIRIGTATQIVSTTTSATAMTINAKGGTISGVYTPYKAPSATTGSGTVKVAANGTITGTGTSFTTTFRVGDLIMIGSEVETVKTIASATSMTTDVDFPTISTASNYSVFSGPGTVTTTSASTTVTGSGTSFTTQLTPGDVIRIGSENLRVSKIASDTSLTTTTNAANSQAGYTYTRFTKTGTTTGPGTVSSAGTSVSGSSGTVATTFLTTFAQGNAIKVGTEVQIVDTVTDDTHLTTYNAFGVANSNASYAKLVSSGVSGAGVGPASASASGTAVTGVATVTSTLFTTTFAVGDVVKVTATAEPQAITAITDDTNMTVALNFASSSTGSAYTAFSPDLAVQPGTVTTSSTTAIGSSSSVPTTFLTTFAVGDQIQIGGQTGTIASITDNFTLTLTAALGTDVTTPSTYANVAHSLSGPGTVTNTAASASVTGTGTNFTTRFGVGESIKIGSETKIIAAITDDTHLTTTTTFTGANTGAAYFGPNGVYFGMGEGSNSGSIFVNGDTTPVPFDAAASRQYDIKVDINYGETCSGDVTTCYKWSRATGFIQNLRNDNMRVSVMFTNSGNGKAGKIQQYFDGAFNSSDINNIRNQHTAQFAALAEATYEALCYYRLTQGPCYSNTPADFVVGGSGATVGGSGDPYFFVSSNQTVSCCKSFILMISAGIPASDGNAPDSQTPFTGMFAGTDTLGVTQVNNGWLDDVAYYGNTHDVRNQGTGVTGNVPNTQQVVFYSVNAMGGAAGAALLSSAAKYGGFADQNGNGLPDAGSQVCTYPAGSNLGTGAGTSSPEWDVDKDCTPDTFFDASQGGDLAAQINNAIAAILKKASSGTSVSVLATSSTGEGAIYQAYFLPETTKSDGTTNTVKWYGYTQGLFIDTFGNIREDTDHDGRLILTNDNIVSLSFDSTTSNVVVLRCPDADGDGTADTTTVGPGLCSNVSLSDIQPLWEAGARLAYLDPGTSCTAALAGVSCRRILTWTDTNYDKVVGSGELIEFTDANQAALCPYLNGSKVADCVNTVTPANQTAARLEASNLIKFHRGEDGAPLGLRDRSSAVKDPDNSAAAPVQKVWKYGDVVDSTPTVVGSPRERYDTIYGDGTYTTFFKQYRNRRQVAYAGANDGMLHAFNAGFFTEGDDATTTPVEHGYFTTTQPATASPQVSSYTTVRSGNPKLGAELWAFIPQSLLPHLKWYADINYTHVAYVDLKPKVTDVRVFCGDTATGGLGSPSTCITGQPGTGIHPGGWGTILIGGMRYGGSCGACVTGSTGGVPMTVTSDFGSGTQTTRTFYSSYFVLDITDPEQDPVLLWTFTDATLGLGVSFPAVARVSPVADGKTDNTNAIWYAVFGSGPTGYTGSSAQKAKFYVVDIARGPTYSADQTSGSLAGTTSAACSTSQPCVLVNTTSTPARARTFSTGDSNSFMGDIITLDANQDFRVDVIYAGNDIVGTTPAFVGKMYRLTTTAQSSTGTPTDLATWGINSSGTRVPSALLANFSCSTSGCTGATKVGPITMAATVSQDTANNIWVFFGSGRFFSTTDKSNTDTQYFFGVKDDCALSTSCDQTTGPQRNNLVNVSGAAVCNPCASGNELTGVSDVGSTALTSVEILGSLMQSTQNLHGWYTTLPASGERALSSPTILGGTVFFTTFVPTTDICVAAGSGSLYALYYLTGTPYNSSIIGSSTAGGTTTMTRSIGLGTGMPSQMAVQIGAQGSGTSGTGGGGSGCAGRVTGYIQASTGVLGQVCGKPAISVYSRMVSWRDL